MNARIKTHSKIQVEPLVTRVALHPFLAGMNREQLALLTDCARPVHFEKGQIIFREGEIANRFYLIEAGKVVLESSEGLRTHGNSPPARSNPPQLSFSTAQFSGNTARRTTR